MLFATTVFTFGLYLSTGFAQTPSAKEPPKAVSVTACLVRGDEPKEVWLAQKDETIYGPESANIGLNAHLGHKVIVKGYVLPEGKKESDEKAQKARQNRKTETADFRVLTLKMISTTCAQ
jgi:hypothetical protein